MKKIKGFTLIELMIVIAIIGILLAVVIPVFKGEVKCTLAGCVSESYATLVTEQSKQAVYQETISKCISGYTFSPNGMQIIDKNGKGIPCK